MPATTERSHAARMGHEQSRRTAGDLIHFPLHQPIESWVLGLFHGGIVTTSEHASQNKGHDFGVLAMNER